MDFDFYELYKDFSTTELLKIVHRPDGYQPGAVDAASRRLSERDIDPEDQAAAQTFYEERERTAREKADRAAHIKGRAADVLQPVFQPGPNVNPEKWFKLFLLVLGLQYSWGLILTLIDLYKNSTRYFYVAGIGLDLITVLYLPFFFYLLYKRKRWGWILVFAGILVGILQTPMKIYPYFGLARAMNRQYIETNAIARFAIQGSVQIAFAVFLWRQDICTLFGVDKRTKTRTLLWTSVITVFIYGVEFIYR